MNRVLTNYFRRWWWVFALVILFQMLMVGTSIQQKGNLSPFFLPVFGGVFLLMMDVQRGFMRTIVCLPVARREMANKWWLITVALPPLATMAVLLAGQILYSFFTPKISFDALWLLQHGIISFLITGTMFFAFAGLTPGWSGSWPERLKSMFFGALWGISCGGSVLFAMSISGWTEKNEMSGVLLLIATSVMTFLGWKDREALIIRKARTLREQISGAKAATTRAEYRAPDGFGGFRFLLVNTARSYAFFALLMIVGMTLFLTLMMAGREPLIASASSQQLLSGRSPETLGLWLAVNSVSLAPVLQIRVLRMLPIKAFNLAGLFIGLPLVLSFLTTGILFAIGQLSAQPDVQPAWDQAIQTALLFVFAVPLILRLGLSPATYAIVFGIFMGSTVAGLPFQKHLPENLSAILLIVTVPLSFWITYRLVRKSSAPYHGPLLRLPGWQGQT